MSDPSLFELAIPAWMVVALATMAVLFFVTAPYGRHSRPGWGPSLPAWLGWMVMEAASPLAFSLFLLPGNDHLTLPVLAFWVLWMVHYVNRAFVYPLRMADNRRPMAISVAGMAVFFNFVNGYINGHYLRLFGEGYTSGWFVDPRFIAGLLLFAAGMRINTHSDAVLRDLRANGSGEYRIPRGGLFSRVSCPNYFGEIVEWFGWACLTWSLAGLAFAIWTAANLIPRAVAHHRWYRRRFSDYPYNRRAVIPYLL